MLPSGAMLQGTHSPAGLVGLRYSGRVSQRRIQRQHFHLCRAVLAVPAPPRQLERPQQPSKAPQPQVPRARRMPQLLHSRCTATVSKARAHCCQVADLNVQQRADCKPHSACCCTCGLLWLSAEQEDSENAALQCRNLRNLICQPLHHSH